MDRQLIRYYKTALYKWKMSVKSNLYFSLFILSLFTSFFASCKKEMVIPRASGRPYEVMVVMNDWEWEAKQGRALFAVLDTDIPGLPQPERSFHISQVDPKRFDSILNIFRNIILVDINKHPNSEPIPSSSVY